MSENMNLEQYKEQEQSIIASRQAQEVQAAMVIAKKFPRDEIAAWSRIQKSCARKGLAQEAEYTYPRGGERVTGPSIRLAEVLAQAWGNIDYGLIELSRNDGESEMMAYSWDLETNVRRTMVFKQKHVRERNATKGGNINLTDGRDIYELTANMGSRRVRACILSVIPSDIVDEAIIQCRKTLAGDNSEPFSDRLRKMVSVFEKEMQVTQPILEDYVGYSVDKFGESDLIKLQGAYRAIRDGISKREDYFKIKQEPKEAKSGLDDLFSKKEGKKNENNKED